VKLHTLLSGAAVAIALAVAVSALPLTHAQGDAASAYKIGVVNGIAVFEGYEKQRDELRGLRTQVEQRQGQIDSELQALDREREALRDRRESISPEEFERQREDWERKVNDLRRDSQRLQEEIDRQSNRVMDRLREDIFTAIQTIGARDNYHLILDADRNPIAQSNVLYHSATLDLTQEVVDYLNAEYQRERAGRSR
jgi:Skp family chaperone for outer membrane proteins